MNPVNLLAMSGDNLAVFCFLESLAVTFFLEGRKEDGWRKYAFWSSTVALCLIGFAWPLIENFWPEAAFTVRFVSKNPESWLLIFIVVMIFISFSGLKKRILDISEAVVSPPSKNSVNWLPWRHMKELSVVQFSKILAKVDPSSLHTRDSSAFYQLIFSAVESEELSHIIQYERNTYSGTKYRRKLDEHSQILRERAILWAKSKGFDVSHIE